MFKLMFDWFLNLSTQDKLSVLSILFSLIPSVVAIVISIKALKQSSNAIIESSRANIMLYFDISTTASSHIVLKNFGNSLRSNTWN